MWWWIGEDIVGFGGMKNGSSVGFGVELEWGFGWGLDRMVGV